ncbi:glycosyltransferase family 2 protein [Nocardioides sp. NPDC023903]|uniref:glycosyltransferase n=1 Tax=Nocardioides sp. NPDC023903 TaxID=3157195 RepID=UPI0034057D81
MNRALAVATLLALRKLAPHWLRRTPTAPPVVALQDDRCLVFVLRVFAEQASVEAALQQWRTMRAHVGNAKLLVACSQAERSGAVPTTADHVRDLLRRQKYADLACDVIVSEAPAPAGIARQTNHAIGTFAQDGAAARTWVKTIDVDTVLGPDVLAELVAAINRDAPAIEIPATFTKNYTDLGVAQRWHAAYQDQWSIDFEQFRGLVKNRFGFVYSAVSGAGACLRLDVLQELGGFPEDVVAEDLALSWDLNDRRIPITTLRSRLVSDVPPTLAQGLAQEVRWSEGAIDATRYALGRARESRRALPLVATIWANVVWASVSPLLAACAGRAVVRRDRVAAAVVTTSMLAYVCRFVALERAAGEPAAATVRRLGFAPLQMLRISVPWWVALVSRVARRSGEGQGVARKSHHG